MHHITHFKPTLFLLLLVGMLGFALSAQSPVALVLGGGGVAVNAWLVYAGRFRPMPRLLANVVTLGALVLVANEVVNAHTATGPGAAAGANPVMIIGHFLVVLQLVKLWEQRLNRDYGQLLVLSLLLMVAAAINTNRFAFGALLATYLCLSLYGCLLYHLKVESDRAREASAVPARAPDPAASRQDRRAMGRSIRRLAGVVAAYAVAAAVLTFLFFPRGPGSGMLPSAQLQAVAQTGFSDHVGFDQLTPLQNDERIIAHAQVSKNGRPLGAGDTVYLRGVALERYRPVRSRNGYSRDAQEGNAIQAPRDRAVDLPGGDAGGGDVFVQRMFNLVPTGNRVLFVVSGTGGLNEPVAFARAVTARRDLNLLYGTDRAVQSEEPLTNPVDYEVVSRSPPEGAGAEAAAAAGPEPFREDVLTDPATRRQVPVVKCVARAANPPLARNFGVRENEFVLEVNGRPVGELPYGRRAAAVSTALAAGQPVTVLRDGRRTVVPAVPADVEAYARQPQVSGVDEQGQPLHAQRPRTAVAHPLDAEIARNVQHHLRTNFTYTMDLTGATRRPGQDPIAWFLSEDGRRGHCEYFAGAMTLLCQTLGMQARFVVGYKCDEFNPFNQQFVVRQSHAHAWVEVMTADGWRTFDPTTGRGGDDAGSDYGVLAQFRHLFDWVETAYANHVVYYNNDTRDAVVQAVEAGVAKPLMTGVNTGWITSRFQDSRLYRMLADPTSGPVAWALSAAAAVGAAWAARRAVRSRRLRRRAGRIGLDALPPAERLRMAQQLSFYDDLLRLLERRRIARPPHQTPLEFARSLLFLPAGAYETVRRVTDVFYRVRYGQQPLSPGLRRRLAGVVARLDAELGKGGARTA